MRKGLFISFEGIDGCGKTTAAERLCAYLQKRDSKVLITREPGGCELGITMRRMLLHSSHAPNAKTETLLFAADRAEHMSAVILPALQRGETVICDRFADSTLAYQGGGRGIERDFLKQLNDFSSFGVTPDITFYLSLPPELAEQRRCGEHDRMEQEKRNFYHNVQSVYNELAEYDSKRIKIIDATQDIQAVWMQIKDEIEKIIS